MGDTTKRRGTIDLGELGGGRGIGRRGGGGGEEVGVDGLGGFG